MEVFQEGAAPRNFRFYKIQGWQLADFDTWCDAKGIHPTPSEFSGRYTAQLKKAILDRKNNPVILHYLSKQYAHKPFTPTHARSQYKTPGCRPPRSQESREQDKLRD